MNPQDLAAIVNGLPISQQVEFLASLRLNNFLVADEITYNAPNEAQVLESLNNVSALILEYQLNFGTNSLKNGWHEGAVQAVVNEKDQVQGLMLNGFFFERDADLDSLPWLKVEVSHD